jgi:hypothetical protein
MTDEQKHSEKDSDVEGQASRFSGRMEARDSAEEGEKTESAAGPKADEVEGQSISSGR